MKLVVISDTHGHHRELGRLSGDVLIHCGDVLNAFAPNVGDIEDLDDWFSMQDFKRILCIAGNHDYEIQKIFDSGKPVFRNAEFLCDESRDIGGYKFYGSPWTPEITGAAFYLSPADAEITWSRIPIGTDVLITHTPPLGFLDRNSRGKSCGCPALKKRVGSVRPRLHCYGHVHASAGRQLESGVAYVNAAMVGRSYRLKNRPVVVKI
ncbi:MAG: metallophosphatase domain-containing protein [Gammaproteobacteria bacterium]